MYFFQSSSFFYYRFEFLAQLLLSTLLYSLSLRRRKGFGWRLPLAIAIMIAGTALFPIVFYNAWWTSLNFIWILALLILCIWLCFDENFMAVLFIAIASYCTQHIAYQFFNALMNISGLIGEGGLGIYSNDSIYYTSNPAVYFAIEISCFFLVYLFCYVFFGRKIDKEHPLEIKYNELLFILLICVISLIVLNAAVTYESYNKYNTIYIVCFSFLEIICSLLLLTVQFQIIFRRKLTEDLDMAYEII